MKYSNKSAGMVALNNLSDFISKSQRDIISNLFKGEEGSYFIEKMVALDNLIANMPKTYEQDGMGDQSIAYLHYFKGNADFYITEKDMEDDQHQAFGLVNMSHGAELGYISIIELMKADVEIDLYFVPTTIGKVKG